jgi:hypothetical protein
LTGPGPRLGDGWGVEELTTAISPIASGVECLGRHRLQRKQRCGGVDRTGLQEDWGCRLDRVEEDRWACADGWAAGLDGVAAVIDLGSRQPSE